MAAPEWLLCDTSLVAHLGKKTARPDSYAHWDLATVERIDNAILAISVITLAEARFGYINAGWGKRRVQEAAGRLKSFIQIPLDIPMLDVWARFRMLRKERGWRNGR